MKKTSSRFAYTILVALLVTVFATSAFVACPTAVQAETTDTEIFSPKDDTTIERFKAHVYNALIDCQTTIDVSEFGLTDSDITYYASGTGATLTGASALDLIVNAHPLFSTVCISNQSGFEFSYQNGKISSIAVTYNYEGALWTEALLSNFKAYYADFYNNAPLSGTDFQKAAYVHDWLCNRISYSQSASMADFAIGAIANGKAVCAGYAYAYQFLAQQLGLECSYVSGTTSAGAHAWNKVKVDNQWFLVDTTWDDGTIIGSTATYKYFLLNDTEFAEASAGGHASDTNVSGNSPSNTEYYFANKYWLDQDGKALTVPLANWTEDPQLSKVEDSGSGGTDPEPSTGGTDPKPNTPSTPSIPTTSNGWIKYNGSWYYYKNSKLQKGWLVTSLAPGNKTGDLERYWLDKNTGALATSKLISASDAGYWAYAKSDGTIVRGKYATDNNIYLANNDGKLENPGWLVTGSYTNGQLERYYIEPSTHSAVRGRSSSGYGHYTLAAGYVVRGAYDDGCGRVWLADNDGRLETQTGWMVTGKYTGGELQRYYMNSGNLQGSAKTSRFTASINGKTSTFFGIGGKGYVLRGYGLGISPTDYIYADNEGRIVTSSWFVTGYWTGGELQRYWFDSNGKVARNRRISASETGSYAAYATDKGYVVRGAYDDGCGRVWLADNDGRLETRTGWMVTGKYTGGELQRYYMNSGNYQGSAKTSHFTAKLDGKTSKFFGIGGKGYVLRGFGYGLSLTDIIYADNEGRILNQ